MQFDYAFLADKATTTHDGKLVVLGGDIDSVTVSDFPVLIQVCLVARLVLGLDENPEGHTFGLECTSAAGNRQKISESRKVNLSRKSEPDSLAASRILLELAFVVSQAGPHFFHLIVDGVEAKTIPFRVNHEPKAAE